MPKLTIGGRPKKDFQKFAISIPPAEKKRLKQIKEGRRSEFLLPGLKASLDNVDLFRKHPSAFLQIEGGSGIPYLLNTWNKSGDRSEDLNLEGLGEFVQKYGELAAKQIEKFFRLKKTYPRLSFEIQGRYLHLKWPCEFQNKEVKLHLFRIQANRIERESLHHFCSVSHESKWRLANDKEYADNFHHEGAKASAKKSRKRKIRTYCLQCNKKLDLEPYRFADDFVKKHGAPEFCSRRCKGIYLEENGIFTWHSPESRRNAAKAKMNGEVTYCKKCGKKVGYFPRSEILEGRGKWCPRHGREERIRRLKINQRRWIKENPELLAALARMASEQSAENRKKERIETTYLGRGKIFSSVSLPVTL